MISPSARLCDLCYRRYLTPSHWLGYVYALYKVLLPDSFRLRCWVCSFFKVVWLVIGDSTQSRFFCFVLSPEPKDLATPGLRPLVVAATKRWPSLSSTIAKPWWKGSYVQALACTILSLRRALLGSFFFVLINQLVQYKLVTFQNGWNQIVAKISKYFVRLKLCSVLFSVALEEYQRAVINVPRSFRLIATYLTENVINTLRVHIQHVGPEVRMPSHDLCE